MVSAVALIAATLFLAYGNGANDNFKGVATLYGSGAASFRTALLVGTLATLAGSLASAVLAQELLKAFSGKGLVPDAIVASQAFLLAVALAAGATVLLAARIGFPISTTHALTGALAGAGFVMAGPALNLSGLGTAVFLPLLLSPVMSLLMTMPLYYAGTRMAMWFGIEQQSCVCIGPRQFIPVGSVAFALDTPAGKIGPHIAAALPEVTTGTAPECVSKYTGKVLGITVQSVVDAVHFLSAAAVSFARGLNDTPKIAGMLLALNVVDVGPGMIAIAAAMAVGGLIEARGVAETMSHRIARMNDGQALTANLVTAMLVIGASRFGMPVSTTHVSVGAITGIGLVNGSANGGVISSVVLSWVLTLPIAALIAAALATALPLAL